MRGRVGPVGVVVAPAPVLSDELLERRLEVLHEFGVDLLVDRDPCGRVRHVDQAAEAPPLPLSASRTCSVMFRSCVLRSVLSSISRTGHYPRADMATAPAALDAYREEADRFIAALDEEYYLHFAGLKESFELTLIYERYADLATLDACRRLGEAAEPADRGAVELWRFACEGYLGNLTREEAEEVAGLEASSRPRSTARASASASSAQPSRTSPTAAAASASTAPGLS